MCQRICSSLHTAGGTWANGSYREMLVRQSKVMPHQDRAWLLLSMSWWHKAVFLCGVPSLIKIKKVWILSKQAESYADCK